MKIHRQALVRFTPEQMFDLVNEVEAYPRRFAWCLGANVLEHDGQHLVARLDLRFAGVTQHFSTRNTLDRPHSIRMQFVDGPFDWLHGVWQFTPALRATFPRRREKEILRGLRPQTLRRVARWRWTSISKSATA